MSDNKKTPEDMSLLKQPSGPAAAAEDDAPPDSGPTPGTTSRPMSPRERWRDYSARSVELLKPQPITANGSAVPDLKRNDSLTVPGKTKSPSKKHGRMSVDKASTESRRSSARSDDSKASNVDFSRLQNAPVVQAKKDEDDKSKNTIQTDDSYIRSAIPYLPQWVAVLCLMLNVVIPGSGTMLCGFSIFCCGKPRVQSKEDTRMLTFCVNVMVGWMQLFTVPFMLVGWFWAFVWGVYMLILAAEHKEEEKQQREKELQAKALTALNANLRPWTLMRS